MMVDLGNWIIFQCSLGIFYLCFTTKCVLMNTPEYSQIDYIDWKENSNPNDDIQIWMVPEFPIAHWVNTLEGNASLVNGADKANWAGGGSTHMCTIFQQGLSTGHMTPKACLMERGDQVDCYKIHIDALQFGEKKVKCCICHDKSSNAVQQVSVVDIWLRAVIPAP